MQVETREGGGGGSTTVWFNTVSSVGTLGPEWPLCIPTWEACKWRVHAVIIYSPQHLTLDLELITTKGKSDWTWRVPKPVTLISVRCLQQEVREEEFPCVSFHCGFVRARVYVCVCVLARWGVGRERGWTTVTQVDKGQDTHGSRYKDHCWKWHKYRS